MEAALATWNRIAPIAGLAIIPLVLLLGVAKMDVRHWHKQSDQFEKLYHAEQTAHAVTVANYRAAATRAHELDQANAARVAGEQSLINERSKDDYETRLAAARATADRLRGELAKAAANSGGRGATDLPGVPAAAGGAAQAAGQDGLSIDDRLTATEQGIQLDELIKWIRRQHAVDVNGANKP
jgi:hypothetical protein